MIVSCNPSGTLSGTSNVSPGGQVSPGEHVSPGEDIIPGEQHAAEPKCRTSDGEINALVVGWSADEKEKLAAAMAAGPVAVRVDHCEIKIISDCTVKGCAYSYYPVPPRGFRETYKDEAKLFRQLPFGSARLVSLLTGSNYLDLQWSFVGQYETNRAMADPALLSGRCSTATHLISNISFGAFSFKEVEESNAGSDGSAVDSQASGSRAPSAGWSASEGDHATCLKSDNPAQPPDSCRSVLSIKLVPIVVGGSEDHASAGPGSQCGRDRPSQVQSCQEQRGLLAPEIIQGIVRQHYDRFRRCYEDGLRSNPDLRGGVKVRFIIGRDGAVSNAARHADSDLPDPAVVQCIVSEFCGISFPKPEGGIVKAVYPMVFEPSE